MKKDGIFNRIIDEICEEEDINQECLSYSWIRRLRKNGQRHDIVEYSFEINSKTSCSIARDKYGTYEVLNSKGIEIIDHDIIFNPELRQEFYEKGSLEKIDKLFESNDKIVVKANDSSCGNDVYLCEDIDSAKEMVQDLFSKGNPNVCIHPYYDITYEYRNVFLDGEILFVYKKEKPFEVVNGEKRYTSWKHNISQGAIPSFVDEKFEHYDEIRKLAVDAAKAIGIRFATVDIIQTKNNEFKVLEINGNVCLFKFAEIVPGGYDIAKEIYRKAVKRMFKNN